MKGHRRWLVPILLSTVAFVSVCVLCSCVTKPESTSVASSSSSVQVEKPYDPAPDIEAIRNGISRDLDPLRTPTPENVALFLQDADQAKLRQLEDTNGFSVRDMLVHLLRGFEYEILDVNAQKDVATVDLRMKCLDGAKALESSQAQAISDEEMGQLGEWYNSGDDEDWKKLIARFAEIIYGNLDATQEMVTRDITIDVARQANRWHISADGVTAIIGALTAGMS